MEFPVLTSGALPLLVTAQEEARRSGAGDGHLARRGRGRRAVAMAGPLTLAALLAWAPCGVTDIIDETRAQATHEVPGLKQVGEAINRFQTEVERGAKEIVGKGRGGAVNPSPPAGGTATGTGAGGRPVKSIPPAQPTADRDTTSVNKGPGGKEDAQRPKAKGRSEKSPAGGGDLPTKPSAKGAKAVAKTTGLSGEPASAAPVAPKDGRAPPAAATPVPPATGGPGAAIPAAAPVAAGAAASDPPPPPPGPAQAGDAAPLAGSGAASEPPVPEGPVSARESVSPSPLTGRVFRDCDDCPEYVPILGTDGEPGGAPGGDRPGLIPSAFGMTRHEITFAQYDQFCMEKARPCPGDEGWGRGERPAINLTQDDAASYADWLSKKTGRRYRLPTEAEWELAARAGTKTRYWWGEDMEPGRANCTGCGGTWDGRQTAPVGSCGPNPWGLYDTAGNVWEWTSSAPFAGSDPLSLRVIRGGAWSRDGSAAAVGHRVFNSRGFRSPNLGFRLVREGPPPGRLKVTASTVARISVNGRPSGEAGPERPLLVANLDPGDYRVEAFADGFASKSESYHVGANVVTEVSMVLDSEEELAWSTCAGAATATPCQDYLKSYPHGAYAAEAAGRIDRVVREAIAAGMVKIPGGTFTMGCSPGNGHCDSDERPAHQVKIKPLRMGKYEVTQGQWRAVMGSNPSKFTGDERPVEQVSWDDIQTFLQRLNAGNPGKPYRLPSEAEWEYAARAGTNTPYWWGDQSGQGHANCAGCGSRWDNKETAPVGSFPANAFGLYDTAGNVCEWVQDCWHDTYQGSSSDGKEWRGTCRGDRRVLRGGSWYSYPGGLRVSYRLRLNSDYRSDYLGLRLAQDP